MPKRVLREAAPLTGHILTILIDNRPVSGSVRWWARETGISEATIHYRRKHGWNPYQCLEMAPAPGRDRAQEQRQHAVAASRVVVFWQDHQGHHPLTHAKAAAILNIKPTSLAQRLRPYRPADGSQAWVDIEVLKK